MSADGASGTWDYIGALTGVAASVVLVVPIIDVAPPPPIFSGTTILDHYLRYRSEELLSALLGGIGWLLFLWFLSSLRGWLKRAEGPEGRLANIAFAAGTTLVALALVNNILPATLAFGASDADASIALAFSNLTRMTVGFAALPAGAMLLAIALISIRTTGVPRWLGAAAGIISAGTLVAIGGIFATEGPLVPAGSYSCWLFSAFLLWLAITSFTVARSARTSTR